MSDNNEKIKKLEEEIAKLKHEDARRDALDPTHRLAEDLHSIFCTHNHIDMCSWEYEHGPNMWNESTHANYLGRARKVVQCCTKYNLGTNAVTEIIKVARGY